MQSPSWMPWTVLVLDWVVRLGLSARVIMRRLPVPEALAWLVLLLFLPVASGVGYLLVGENRLGRRRLARHERLTAGIERQAVAVWRRRHVEWTRQEEHYRQIARLATAESGFPPLGGNRLSLIGDSDQMLLELARDIDVSTLHCHLLYYIWTTGGKAKIVGEALIRAAGRGVPCRVLVDAVGSRGFLGSEMAERMAAAGVKVAAALPVNPLRMLLARLDLRNHRKIAVIDGRVAYTGSQNLNDSAFGKRRVRRVERWVDATVRLEGPAAQALGVVFLQDWMADSEEDMGPLEKFLPPMKPGRPGAGPSQVVQVVPSGPGPAPDAIHQAILTIIYTAQQELLITTPYFVPDEATRRALQSAAMRGVRVTMVVPGRTDHPLVKAASRAHWQDLLEAGVRILQFRDGLLHAKVITVDRRIGLVGSANLDMRSFWLNFEVTLLMYDDDFASMLRVLQTEYVERSKEVSLERWRRRGWWWRAVDNTAQLLGPLL